MSERVFALPFVRCAARACIASLALVLLPLFVIPAPTAEAGGSTHPYFNDRGTLKWHVRYADARRTALREGKLILVEAGRKKCTMCMKFCRDVLPQRAISSRVSRIAVGLCVEVDRPEAQVSCIISARFSRARMLPLVWFMTPDGKYVAGFWGKRTARQFACDLDRAEAAWRRMNAKTTACDSAPTPKAPVAHKPVPRTPAPTPPAPAPCAPEAPAPADPFAAEQGDGECVCENGVCRFVPRAPATEAPAEPAPVVAEAVNTANGPAPRAGAAVASGSPDGPAVDLPEPTIRSTGPVAEAPPAPRVDRRQPDIATRSSGTVIRPAAKNRGRLQKAQEAAARGQWGRVLSTVGTNAASDPALLRLTRQAHQWAHEKLEEAVRHLAAGRTTDARRAVDEVKDQMAGHPEEDDALRGREAIEFVEDLAFLSDSSAVRRAVRRSAHERLRGSRWAQLFRDAR